MTDPEDTRRVESFRRFKNVQVLPFHSCRTILALLAVGTKPNLFAAGFYACIECKLAFLHQHNCGHIRTRDAGSNSIYIYVHVQCPVERRAVHA